MRSPDAPAGARPAGHAAVPPARFRVSPPRLSALSLGNWPVSRRLIAVIVIALVMGLVFGALRVASAADTATGFARTTQLAVLGEEVTALAQAMENERDLTAALCAASPGGVCPVVGGEAQAPGNGAKGQGLSQTAQSLLTDTEQAQAATDAAASRVQTLAAGIGSSFPANTQAKATAVLAMIGNIPGLRSQVSGEAALSVIQAYSEAIADLFPLNDEITSGSSDAILADEVRTLGSLSRAKDQASQERAILYAALLQGTFSSGGGLQALTTAQGLESADLLAFQSSATPAEVNTFLNTVNGEKVNTAQLMDNFLSVITNSKSTPAAAFANAFSNILLAGQVVTQATAPGMWYSSMSDTIARMRAVESQIATAIVARSQSLEQGARQSAELTAAVTGAVLLLVLLLTVVVARSLVNPLRRLQADALDIATVRLPARVAELSQTADPNVSLDVEPISVQTTDEIGKVARAFDQVHREAVRLAGNEAMLRGSLSAMFISLSRRSVPLIERLARMIDSLEQNEDDPDRLSNLFSMDHLVTRMRRNSENLLVLAGEEPVRKWSEPVPLTDVARAATSEIEQYNRVVLNVQPGIVVSGQAASDVVHLLAEIIENATLFSPRDTPVHVSGQELSSGGVLLEVRDSGVGVSEARLAEMNWRLDNPPMVDVSVSRHMGLFAVSRLAARHGVRVRLRAASPQGLSALVWLPGTLTGRDAVRHVDPRPQSLAREPAAALRIGGRRVPGRHSAEPRADGQQAASADGHADSAPVTTAGSSEWFRPKRPSSARAQAATAEPAIAPGVGPAPRAEGAGSRGGDWSRGGAGGWRIAEALGAPVRGDRTRAGLPTRIPGANLFPGTAGDRPAAASLASTGDMAAAGPQSHGYEAAQAPGSRSATLPRRSPELARSRLSGFQLGSREAEGRTAEERS
jgi:signal transduction histidine kinase